MEESRQGADMKETILASRRWFPSSEETERMWTTVPYLDAFFVPRRRAVKNDFLPRTAATQIAGNADRR